MAGEEDMVCIHCGWSQADNATEVRTETTSDGYGYEVCDACEPPEENQ